MARHPAVLVVDDEVVIRAVLTDALESDGFEVVPAANGHEALKKLADRADFAAVLSDVKMPELGGAQLYNEVAARWPALTRRFFFMSGAPVPVPGAQVIAKPFRLDEVLRVVREVVGA
jgi:CheY-like chemotaxis protein